MGNTVVVVEHDEDTMRAADHIVDFGPGPGVRGGEVVAAGTLGDVVAKPAEPHRPVPRRARSRSTSPSKRRPPATASRCRSSGRRHNNLKNIDVEIPLGRVRLRHRRQRLGQELAGQRHPASKRCAATSTAAKAQPGEHDRIEGLEHLDKLIDIDQSPIGRTPRSNPATYIKVFDEIRDLYAQLPEAKMPRLQAGPVQLQRRRAAAARRARATARTGWRWISWPTCG